MLRPPRERSAWQRLLGRGLLLAGYQPDPPAWLVIEATNHCGKSCPVCGAAQARRQAACGLMEWEVFEALAREAERMRPRRVCLHAHGEPLLHPRIVEMVARLSALGLATQLVTSGDRLGVELSGALRDAGLDELVVSHHGVSPENFLACRGEELSEQDEQRLARALAAWEGSGRSVAVRCLVLPGQVPDGKLGLARFLGRWLAVPGVQRVELTPYQPWPRHVREDLLAAITRRPRPCLQLRDGLNVLWNGTITPCSFDTLGELALGRFPDLSLGEAYNGPVMRRLRRGDRFGGRFRARACRACLVTRGPDRVSAVLARDVPGGDDGRRQRWLAEAGRQCWIKLAEEPPGARARDSKSKEA